jgi:hypothetical protein
MATAITLSDLVQYLREARDGGYGAAYIEMDEETEEIEHGMCGARTPMARSRYGDFAIAWMSPLVVKWQQGTNVPVGDDELLALAKKWRSASPLTFRMMIFKSANWGGKREGAGRKA